MLNNDNIVHVAVAIICRNQKILISHRLQHLDQGGLWEFPGGKVEVNENSEQALFRELQEELNIQVEAAKALFCIKHHYSDKQVRLHIWKVTAFSGKARGMEGQQIRWVNRDELNNFEFPAANLGVLDYLLVQS